MEIDSDMTTQTQALVTRTKEDESNGWEELLPLLDPAMVSTPRAKPVWKKLGRDLVFWLTHTVAPFPWLNHLALASVIYSESGAAHPQGMLRCLNSFLRWAIPEHYPDVAALKPVEALLAYFGDPPQVRGTAACRGYNAIQLHTQRYLESLPTAERAKLTPFLFPFLINTPPLTRLRRRTGHQGEEKRKEQAFAVVKDLQALVVMGRRRYKWLADLEAQVQQITELNKEQSITLPAVIQCKDLDHRHDLTFRVWDRRSWIKHHPKGYGRGSVSYASHDQTFFLQLVGALPDTPWFLRAMEFGSLTFSGKKKTQTQEYFQDCNVPQVYYPGKELITPNKRLAQILRHARQVADGTPEDSRFLFCVEPLLAAAALGLFALVCLTQSGMRIGELQQVSGDNQCMKIGIFPTFDQTSDAFAENSVKLFFWQLYPKGSTERQPYPVTPYMQEALKVWMEVHDRFCGSFKDVSPARTQFSHARHFQGKHRFVLQWKGRHLPTTSIEGCLDFLLLEHLCLDSHGKRTRITAHVLRHGVAGYLRQQGIPLQDIANLLHQVNLIITDYYSKLSPQDLFAKVGPALTRLSDLAEIDPTTLRSVGDIQKLGQEALKRFGVLRCIPGGTCAVFTACEVQFKCASCPSYIPDPSRGAEVREKISSCARTAEFLHKSGDFLQAEVQKAHGRQWERIAKEMQALATIELTTPPFENALKEFGIDNLDEVDDEWLLTLKQQPQLPPGGNPSHD
jgi:integrase